MIQNEYSGKLIAIDGPNGVGKTTIISKLKENLEKLGHDVCITKEPTETELGIFLRKYAETNTGIGVACLVATDRYHHIENTIIPMLKKGKTVITDRYILSSLIFQRIDNVDVEFILNTNSNILIPDLQIALTADSDVIQKRLSERKELTRFEVGNQTLLEIQYLNDGVNILTDIGFNVEVITNHNSAEDNMHEIISYIAKL